MSQRRQRVTESVVEQILSMVREEGYSVNQRLPTESQLMARTGGGRSSVREALHGLAVLGMVEIRQGAGTYIRSLTPRTVGVTADLLAEALAMGTTEDLLEARSIVEVRMVSLAAQRALEEDLEDMRSLLEAARTGLARKESVFRYGAEFHLSVARASHNTVLEGFVASIADLLTDRGPSLSRLPGYTEWEIAEHTRIYEAISDHDARLAGQRMREHLEAMTVHYERLSTFRPRMAIGLR
jgi:GntR family transcriptional regulator, transcriptional repressor for pyruvate dehydrogenase complex